MGGSKLVSILVLFLITLSTPLHATRMYVTGLVVCERVTRADGRYSFFNIKDRLYFKKSDFPAVADFETAVSIVSEIRRKVLFKAAIMDSSGKVISVLPNKIISLDEYPKFFLISWRGVKFPSPGKYLIKIYLNNKLHYIYPLWVVTLKK